MTRWLVLGAAVLALAAADEPKDKEPAPAAALEGTWVVQSLEREGKKMADAELKKVAKVTFKGDKYTWSDPKVPSGTFAVNTSVKPWTVEYTDAAGQYKDKTYLGILELEGDTLKECYALPPGSPRPKKFESAPKSGVTLIVWKREKAKP